jgi:ankyrin repeat protein
LEHGADVNAINEDSVVYLAGTTMPLYASGGRTPLHYAAEHGEEICVELLLAHGSNKAAKDFDGHTPYDLALLKNYSSVAEMLRLSDSDPISVSI